MFAIGDEIFVHFARDERKRILHSATITAMEDGFLAVEFEETDLSAETDQSILLFFHVRGKFHQQPAKIVAIEEEQPHLLLRIRSIGESASAESREYYRVCTVPADLTVDVDGDESCPLMDVSASGLSIVSSKQYGIGHLLQIQIRYDDEVFEGRASIQSVKSLADGRTRYGLLCVAEDDSQGNLRIGLRKLSVSVQHQQLQRLAGIV